MAKDYVHSDAPQELRCWQRLEAMQRANDKLTKDLEALKKQAKPEAPVKGKK